MTDAAVRFTVDALVRQNLLAAIFRRPGAQAVLDSPAATANRFRDDAAQAEVVVTQAYDLCTAGVFVVAALVVMTRINPAMTAFVFVPLAAVIVASQRAFGGIVQNRRAGREATGSVAGLLGEVFEAATAVQLAGAEERVIAHFSRLSDARRRAMVRDVLGTRLLDAVVSNAVGVGTGTILLLGAGAMRAGTFTVGDFALFSAYLSLVTWFVQMLGRALAAYRQAGVSFQRLADAIPGQDPRLLVDHRPLRLRGSLPVPPPVVHTAADRLHLLDVRGLTYRHAGSGRGVEGVDLRIPRGVFVVLTGRVGAGKTTLLRTLLGLLPAQTGEIRWNGAVVADPATFFVPPRSAYVPQVPRLFSDTLQDNILLGRIEDGPTETKDEGRRTNHEDPGTADGFVLRPSSSILHDALHAATLDEDMGALERGLDTVVGPRGVKLSGGQVQRTAAARAFIRKPEVLVLDDLSSALDAETERTLWQRLFERPAATCLVVSHRRAALERAGHIVVLKHGRVDAAGPLPHVLDTSAEFRAIWEAAAQPPAPRQRAAPPPARSAADA
jgi:ATP-binding cassette subfamily B protein